VVPEFSCAYSHPVSVLSGRIILNVTLNTLLTLSFTDAFISMVVFCVEPFRGVTADMFTGVLSIVMLMFCDVFARLFVFVAFVLRLYVPSVSVAELNVVL